MVRSVKFGAALCLLPGTAVLAAIPGHEQIRSPQVNSAAAGWGDWMELCTPSLPPAIHITRADFHLEGDRACGAWSECKIMVNSPLRVCYDFRLQGNNDQPNNQYTHGHGVLDFDTAPGFSNVTHPARLRQARPR